MKQRGRQSAGQAKFPDRNACILAFLSLLLTMDGKHSKTDPKVKLFFFCTAIAILGINWLRRIWFRIRLDDTAVCAVIPIDHMYDISNTHSRTRMERILNLPNRVSLSSYVVCYQPDGRYILPVPLFPPERYNAVAVVRCHGMLRWTLVNQEADELR